MYMQLIIFCCEIRWEYVLEYSKDISSLLGNQTSTTQSLIEDPKEVLKVNMVFIWVQIVFLFGLGLNLVNLCTCLVSFQLWPNKSFVQKDPEPTSLKAAWELMESFYADKLSQAWLPERLVDWLAVNIFRLFYHSLYWFHLVAFFILRVIYCRIMIVSSLAHRKLSIQNLWIFRRILSAYRFDLYIGVSIPFIFFTSY